MKPSTLASTALLALSLSTAVHAVHLDPGGRGQVLVYPYYTVNSGQQTLLSVTNTASVAQAVRVRFREGYNGRDVLATPTGTDHSNIRALQTHGLSAVRFNQVALRRNV